VGRDIRFRMTVKHKPNDPEDYYNRFVHLQKYFDDFYKDCPVHEGINSHVMHSLVDILEVASDEILGELDELISGCSWSTLRKRPLSSVLNSPALDRTYISLRDFKIEGVVISSL
jgi:hypothetical protein